MKSKLFELCSDMQYKQHLKQSPVVSQMRQLNYLLVLVQSKMAVAAVALKAGHQLQARVKVCCGGGYYIPGAHPMLLYATSPKDVDLGVP